MESDWVFMTDLKALRDEECPYGDHLVSQDRWKEGWDACINHLSQLAGEVDEHALEEQGEIYLDGRHKDRAALAAKSGFKSGARFQFDQMSARVGLAESALKEFQNFHRQDSESINGLLARIAELELEIKSRKQWLSERDERCGELISRVGTLEQQLAEANATIERSEVCCECGSK